MEIKIYFLDYVSKRFSRLYIKMHFLGYILKWVFGCILKYFLSVIYIIKYFEYILNVFSRLYVKMFIWL
jgi:hypothetical protein